MGRVLVMAWEKQSKGWQQKQAWKRPYEDQMMTPFQLYEWASKNIPSVTFVYCTTEEYEREKSFQDRFQKSRMIAGTRSLHAFIPKTTDTMTTKRFSLSTTPKT